MIRVLLAEDQTMVRGALAALLEPGRRHRGRGRGRAWDEVVGRRSPPSQTSRCSISRCPAAMAWRRRQLSRQALPSCRMLILTTFGRPGYLRRAMESGAVGFLLKDAPAAQLAPPSAAPSLGERIVDPSPGLGGAERWEQSADRA